MSRRQTPSSRSSAESVDSAAAMDSRTASETSRPARLAQVTMLWSALPEQVAKVSGEGYLLGTIMHEICHGLGPDFAHNAKGEKISIREAIGPIYGGLEEAKADVVGMFALKWLVDHGVLPKEKLQEYYASYVAGNFRTLRFGAAEAHGQAEMMEFNYYLEHGAVRRLDSVDVDPIFSFGREVK